MKRNVLELVTDMANEKDPDCASSRGLKTQLCWANTEALDREIPQE